MQTAKALAAGLTGPLTIILLWWLAPHMGFERPPIEDFQDAVKASASLLISGALSYAATWTTPNKEKTDEA